MDNILPDYFFNRFYSSLFLLIALSNVIVINLVSPSCGSGKLFRVDSVRDVTGNSSVRGVSSTRSYDSARSYDSIPDTYPVYYRTQIYLIKGITTLSWKMAKFFRVFFFCQCPSRYHHHEYTDLHRGYQCSAPQVFALASCNIPT